MEGLFANLPLPECAARLLVFLPVVLFYSNRRLEDSLKRTWKPRSLNGEEKFSWPKANPDCDPMGAHRLNEPTLSFMTRMPPYLGGGLFEGISGDVLCRCFAR